MDVCSLDACLLNFATKSAKSLSIITSTLHSHISFNYELTVLVSYYCRCFTDCGQVIAASNKLRVTSECPNAPCIGSQYEWSLTSFNNDTQEWKKVPIFPHMTATDENATNIIFKPNSLTSNSKYKLSLVIISREGWEGYGELEFATAGSPHGGSCKALTVEGIALSTQFVFECFDWQDRNQPLEYEFSSRDEVLSYGRSPKSVPIFLPAGTPNDNYELLIKVTIKNALGVAVEEAISVKVKNKRKQKQTNITKKQKNSNIQF